jgi:flagellar basal body-associated protein FliL
MSFNSENKSGCLMSMSQKMKQRKEEVRNQILEFLKEGSKNFEEIVAHRKASLSDKRKGTEQLKIDLSQHLSDMATLGLIVVMRDAEQKKQYKLP